ncbi:hypothetical protein JQ310_19650, partial [Leptospira interrogans]|nr:hypothetical protein [Leptospira interrogans]
LYKFLGFLFRNVSTFLFSVVPSEKIQFLPVSETIFANDVPSRNGHLFLFYENELKAVLLISIIEFFNNSNLKIPNNKYNDQKVVQKPKI